MVSSPLAPVRESEVSPTARRWLTEQLAPARPWLRLAVGAGVVEGALLVVQAYLVAAIVAGACFARQAPEAMWPWFVGLLGCVVLRAGVSYLRERAGFRAGARVRQGLRETLLHRLLIEEGGSPGPGSGGDAAAGELTTAALEQVESLHDYVARYLPQRALAAAVPLTIALAVAPLSWAAFGILLLTAPLIPFFAWLVGKGAARASRRQFTALGRLGSHFVDRLGGLSTLRLMDRVEAESAAVGEAAEELRRRTLKVLRIAFITSAVLELFTALGIGLVAVHLGLTLLGSMSFGLWGRALGFEVALFILILSAEFYLPLRGLGTLFHTRATATGAASALAALLKESRPSPQHSDALPVEKVLNPLPVTLEGVTVRPEPDGPALLQDVSFAVGPREHLAVVGPSGAGKSTLIQVLLGLVDVQDGEVRAGDRSLGDWGAERWRREVAWVGQRPRLFHGSLRDNIALGRPDASAADVEAAARAAQVLEFARELPRGLDTAVGELGVGLSGGQVQRVALARAYLKDAPLLLLDEPTANLDARSERWVLEGLAALTVGRAVLSVTHRLDACVDAHRVAVLDAGRLVQLGTHDALLAEGGAYARLIRGESTGKGGAHG